MGTPGQAVLSRAPGDLRRGWPATRAFLAVASGCVVAGGLVAAVTGPLGLAEGSWLAAYLVLVAGVAQAVLGTGQSLLAARTPGRGLLAGELATWNIGNACVVVGTLLSSAAVVTVGSASLVGGLVLFLTGLRGSPARATWALRGYVLVVVVVAASIPVGVALSVLRRGWV